MRQRSSVMALAGLFELHRAVAAGPKGRPSGPRLLLQRSIQCIATSRDSGRHEPGNGHGLLLTRWKVAVAAAVVWSLDACASPPESAGLGEDCWSSGDCRRPAAGARSRAAAGSGEGELRRFTGSGRPCDRCSCCPGGCCRCRCGSTEPGREGSGRDGCCGASSC